MADPQIATLTGITEEQTAEIMRLASLWTTRKVRYIVTRAGNGGINETIANTERTMEAARQELRAYLLTLQKKSVIWTTLPQPEKEGDHAQSNA